MSRYIGWLLATKPFQSYLQSQIPEGGPDEAERESGKTYLWGMASDPEGNTVESRMQGPEGYKFTMLTALQIAERVIAGDLKPGFQTPAKAYGADLVMEIEGVTRQDI